MGLGGKGFRIREQIGEKWCHWVLGKVRWGGVGSGRKG
jgi:hypothetical protein